MEKVLSLKDTAFIGKLRVKGMYFQSICILGKYFQNQQLSAHVVSL